MKPVELCGPECPPSMIGHWQWFVRLNGRRQHGMNGPMPLTFVEIKAWQELMDVELTPFDVEVIIALDDVALNQKEGK